MKEITNFKEEWGAFQTEAKFALTMSSLEWAHRGGEIMCRHFPKGDEKSIASLTDWTGKSRATIYNWRELYQKYPEGIEKAIEPHGKNITMSLLLGRSVKPEKEPTKEKCNHKCPVHCPPDA